MCAVGVYRVAAAAKRQTRVLYLKLNCLDFFEQGDGFALWVWEGEVVEVGEAAPGAGVWAESAGGGGGVPEVEVDGAVGGLVGEGINACGVGDG